MAYSSVSSATSSKRLSARRVSRVKSSSSSWKAASTNVVYRLGIAKTRAAARQLVSHRHITVDGQVVNIPSYTLKPGQVVGVREKAKSLEVITDSLAGRSHSSYSWLEWNQASLSGKFLSAPQREDIPEEIKEQLIVELYSK